METLFPQKVLLMEQSTSQYDVNEMRTQDIDFNFSWLKKQVIWYGQQIDYNIENVMLRGIYIKTCEGYKKELKELIQEYPEVLL